MKENYDMDEAKEMDEATEMDEAADMDEAKEMDEMDLDELLRELDAMDEEDSTMDEGKAAYEYEKGKKAGKKMEEANDSEGYEGQMGMKKLGTKEMEEADEITGVDEMDLEELLRELDAMEEDQTINLTSFPDEPGEHGNVAGQNVNEAEEIEYEDEDADGIEDSEDEEIDIENMDESDLKSFIEGVIADMVAAGELEGGHEGMEGEEGEEEESEEEIEINERKKYGGNKGDVPAKKRGDKKDTAEEEGVEDYKKKLKEELTLALEAVETLRSELNEVNLLNAKLLYVNKIFNAKNLNESQKLKVVKAFDKAESAKEAKLVYESLSEAFLAPAKAGKTQLKESLGFASKAAGNAPGKSQIVENDAWISRMQKLANIKL
jgi:hypothetical protein